MRNPFPIVIDIQYDADKLERRLKRFLFYVWLPAAIVVSIVGIIVELT